MIDREPRRSCASDDQQAPPHQDGTHRTEDPGRCSDVPSSPVSDAKYRQKTESVFAKTFKSLLQQNLPEADSCDVEEERRLLHVGMTRGRNELDLIGRVDCR